MPRKPQPWYASLNQPPRSPADGKYRRPPSTPHRRPADRTDPGAGLPSGTKTAIRTKLPNPPWRTINTGAPAGASASIDILPGAVTYISPLFEPPSPTAIPYAGVRVGEIIGYRFWLVLADNQLSSVAHYRIWTPGETVEGKLDEVAEDRFWLRPIFGGVYSFHTLEQVEAEVKEERDNHYLPASIQLGRYPGSPVIVHGVALGTIKCWGEVVEHEHGWRAQYAKLHSLDDAIGEVDLEALKRRYHV